ncbi:putative exonuclease, partial [Escherichia coli EC1736]
QIHY